METNGNQGKHQGKPKENTWEAKGKPMEETRETAKGKAKGNKGRNQWTTIGNKRENQEKAGLVPRGLGQPSEPWLGWLLEASGNHQGLG